MRTARGNQAKHRSFRPRHAVAGAGLVGLAMLIFPASAYASSWSTDPTGDFYAAYYICEDGGCAVWDQEAEMIPAAEYQAVSGGTKIYEDSIEATFFNNSTDPAEPYVSSWAIGQFVNGTAVYVMQSPGGNGGCYNSLEVPNPPDEQVICSSSNYNTSGATLTSNWNVQGGFTMEAYQVDTECISSCGALQVWTP